MRATILICLFLLSQAIHFQLKGLEKRCFLRESTVGSVIQVNVKSSDQARSGKVLIRLVSPKGKLVQEVRRTSFRKQLTSDRNGTYSLCITNEKDRNYGISFTFNSLDNWSYEPEDLNEKDSKDMMIMMQTLKMTYYSLQATYDDIAVSTDNNYFLFKDLASHHSKVKKISFFKIFLSLLIVAVQLWLFNRHVKKKMNMT